MHWPSAMMTTPPSSLLPPTPRSGPLGAPQSTSESHMPPTPRSGPDGGDVHELPLAHGAHVATSAAKGTVSAPLVGVAAHGP
eukprot:7863325-Pyramimonas_sp.AAC.1